MILDAGDKWMYYKQVFSIDECNAIVNYSDRISPVTATVGDNSVRTDVRRSEIRWISQDDRAKWIYDRLYSTMRYANGALFGFNIANLQDIQYTTYYGHGEDFYDWHVDELLSNSGFMRKLSCVVMLSEPQEYTGGLFEFRDVLSPEPNEFGDKGDVLFFPSYFNHKVHPVTSGTRRTLVGWFEGPKWT